MLRAHIQLFHILVVGGLFLFIGINREKTIPFLFTILFYLGFGIIAYHLYRLYQKWTENKSGWVNLIHILLIGPLLITIGYYRERISRKYFEMLIMFGFAAIGYHSYNLITE